MRYPGGKASMADLLTEIRRCNGLGRHAFAEPFAGGAGAALTLLFLEHCPEIFINDADPAMFDFWWTVVNRSGPFLDQLDKKRVSMAEWRRQREVYADAGASRLRRGFAAFYLNRCNRSGIIMNGGPIGGPEQDGRWKINARFNKAGLRERIERIVEYRSRISVSSLDGIDFIRSMDADSTFFFIDPPYYEKGQTLYLNSLDDVYHKRLADCLKSMKRRAWVVTYDDCEPIRRLYEGWADIRPFSLRYAASRRRMGSEIMITPKWMQLPIEQRSLMIDW
ncbi:MAG: DNA adenine methylase [bacterium]|nr:DNA adenine methylase [bacterium]